MKEKTALGEEIEKLKKEINAYKNAPVASASASTPAAAPAPPVEVWHSAYAHAHLMLTLQQVGVPKEQFEAAQKENKVLKVCP